MKIQITLKTKAKSDAASAVEIVAGCSETVASIKERVAGVQLVPFPDQELHFNGQVLADEAKLSQCGVADGCDLDLVIKADEGTLAQQFADLVQSRDLSADELGLLYCYKHGANINQALKFLGFEGKLQDFIAKQKILAIENGSVSLVRVDTALKPFSAEDEVIRILQSSPTDYMDIKELSSKFTKKFGVGLSSIVGCRPVEFLSRSSAFVVHGNHKHVSLHGLQKRSIDSAESQPTNAPVAAPPGLSDGPPGLSGAPLGLDKNSVIAPKVDLDTQQYVDLHSKIYGKSFTSKTTQDINDLVAAISEGSFLELDHVVIAGSIGKGTAIRGRAIAEVVLFVQGLPLEKHGSWLPSLLKAIAATLSEQVAMGISGIHFSEDSVKVSYNDIDVSIHISPVFESYCATLRSIAGQGPEFHKWYAPALAKESTKFIARQASSVKTTIRLMKWWRDQQQWSKQRCLPSDELLELATVYSAIQTKPADQKTAIANTMSLLSHFSRLRVVWSNFYSKDDVPPQLLRQRPLLMDPVNPYINVADPEVFDSSELMALAQSTHFFW
jgi:hypothetical protein